MFRLVFVVIVAFLISESNQKVVAVTEAPDTTDKVGVKRIPYDEKPIDLDDAPGCWTNWFDRDNPGGTGDWETLTLLQEENPKKVCPKPTGIEVKTLSGLSLAQTKEKITMGPTTGFYCKNKEQKDGMCEDYKVRFRCVHPYCADQGCWTNWYDRDNPSGTGDWELLSNLRKENPNEICEKPLDMEVITTKGNKPANVPADQTGDVFFRNHPHEGFVCKNKDQKPARMCQDYQVRFKCKC